MPMTFRLERQTLPRKRVIEIEQGIGVADFLEHARVASTARGIEFDDVAGNIGIAECRLLAQRFERQPLDQFRVALAEALRRR